MPERRGRKPDQPWFVRELFNLLEYLGVDWHDTQQALGAPRSPMVQWRYGQRPISKAFAAPFIRYTMAAVDRGLADARAHDVVSTGTSLLTTTSSAIDFEMKVRDCIAKWERELCLTTGEHDRQIRQWTEILWDLHHQDASKQTAFEQQRGFYAAKRLQVHYAEILRAAGQEEALEALQGYRSSGFNHDFRETPAARLAVLARWAGIALDAPAEAS